MRKQVDQCCAKCFNRTSTVKRRVDELVSRHDNYTLYVLLLTTAGFVLRIYALGDLGFRWDEDLTAITVKAINEHGYPLLDSGMVYPRFLPLQYLMAAWTSIFGFSEFTLRFPIVVFGTALIPLTYVIARDLVGPKVGLVAAALMTFDFWQVELARTARMYAPFFLAYGLFIVSVYRGLLWENRRWKLAILPLGLFTILLHDVGLFCAGIVLVPVLVSRTVRRSAFPYIASVTLVAFTSLLGRFSASMWSLSRENQQVTSEARKMLLADVVQALAGIAERLRFLHFPRFELLGATWSTTAGTLAWSLAAVVSLVVVFRQTRSGTWLARLVALSAVVLALLHQYTLSLLLLAAFAGLQLQGLRGFLARGTIVLGVVLLALGLFWTVTAGVLGGVGAAEAEYFVKTLFEYPRVRLTMAYPINRPAMTVLALVGGLLLFDRCARVDFDKRSAMIFATFAISYFAVGMFVSKYSHFRYVLHADVLFMPMAAAGIWWTAVSAGSRRSSTSTVCGPHAVTTVTAILLILAVANPVRSVLAVTRDYTASSTVERWMDIGSWPDYKTTSAYIRANWQPGDQVLVLEPREYYSYLGRIDGWIRSHDLFPQVVYWGGVPHDRYIGVPVLQSLDEVREAIEGHEGRTWLPFSAPMVARGGGGVDDAIAAWLMNNSYRTVMTGRDNARVVYLFEGSSGSR